VGVFLSQKCLKKTILTTIMEPLTKEYVDERLGENVLVDRENRVIAYEHNVGKLALYSEDGERLIRMLEEGDVIRFGDGVEKLFSGNIEE